jgi:hypothetical protein
MTKRNQASIEDIVGGSAAHYVVSADGSVISNKEARSLLGLEDAKKRATNIEKPIDREIQSLVLRTKRKVRGKKKNRKREKAKTSSPKEPTKLGTTPKLPTTLVKCPHCCCEVKATRLRRHILRCHTPSSRKARSNNSARRHLPKDMGQCRFCGCKMNTKSLRKHIVEVHKQPEHVARAATKQLSKQKGSLPPGPAMPPNQPERGLSREDRGWSDRNDASLGWGHHFRDSGRFGSYPGHDSFNDEAMP